MALGLLQGPTELLPVSSSAHTALLPWFAGWPYDELDADLRKSFEVALHAGAGLALALAMREELLAVAARLCPFRGYADARRAATLALALAPPALAGFFLHDQIEARLGGPRAIAAGLLLGTLAMGAAERGGAAPREGAHPPPCGRRQTGRGRPCADAGPLDGLALGLAQAAALVPGVSRSGAALSAARGRGFTRDGAWRFAWAVALPVFAGASLLQGVRLLRGPSGGAGLGRALAAGAGAAFASTLASAAAVRRLRLAQRGPAAFAAYRGVLAAAVLLRARRARLA